MSASENLDATTIYQPGDRVPLPLDAKTHEALRADLSQIDAFRRRFEVALLTPPAEGSAAATDQADKLRAYAHDQAAMAIVAALDHLQTWRTLLGAGEMPTYAHMTLLRTAHEAALLAYWLIEPGIDSDVRRRRGVAAQWDDYDERRRFEDAAGIASFEPPAKLAKDRLADLMTMAAKIGLVRRNKKRDKILTVQVPGIVDLFDLYEPPFGPGARAQAIYRLESGYAHAKQWALALGGQRVTPRDPSGRSLAIVQGLEGIAIEATHRAVAAAERAVTAYENLRS